MKVTVVEYLEVNGQSPYGKWFDDLSVPAAMKITTTIGRMEEGNLSNLKSVGGGVSE